MIPSALERYTEHVREFAVEAATVREALDAACVLWPALSVRLFDGTTLWPYLLVFVNDTRGNLDTRLSDGDCVDLVAAAVGG